MTAILAIAHDGQIPHCRPLDPAPRSARQGHRPRRVHAQPAPARHAVRQDRSAAPSRTAASAASTSSAARAVPGVHAVITGEDIRKLIPEPYYGPAFHDQPILALDKVRYVGEPVARGAGGRSARRGSSAAQLIVAEYEELPAVFDEVEAMTSQGHRARGAQARGHVPRSEASGRQARHQHRARFSSAPRRCRSRRSRRPTTCSSTPSARSRCCTCRSSRSSRSPSRGDDHADDPHRLAEPVVRAHRDRAPARLAGEPGAREGAAISAAASAPRSTSSSKRSSRRSRCSRAGR